MKSEDVTLISSFSHLVLAMALAQLKNTFVLLRHGQSTANATGIIVSKPENGVGAYGLTEKGKAQASQAGQCLASMFAVQQQGKGKIEIPAGVIDGSGPSVPPSPGSTLVFVSSDFARAKETAEIAAAEVGAGGGTPLPVTIDIRLRERAFGEVRGEQVH